MREQENYNLLKFNTFGMDVCCSRFVATEREEELADYLSGHSLDPETVLVLGGGSNILFTEDFEGTVVYPKMTGMTIVNEDEGSVAVRVGAGEVWDDFVVWAVKCGYGGVENLSLIPGHVGATPVQNPGAYGAEAGDVIERVEALELNTGRKVTMGHSDCCFGYRDSIFKHEWRGQYVVTYVTFRLQKHPILSVDYGSIRDELSKMGGEIGVKEVREAVVRIRRAKLPDVSEWPSAGSFFKNPVVEEAIGRQLEKQFPEMPVYPAGEGRMKLSAGWMIDRCGWKGKSLGHAGVYEKQALVLVNKGGATGLEVTQLANAVKKSVFMRFGVWLTPEVMIL